MHYQALMTKHLTYISGMLFDMIIISVKLLGTRRVRANQVYQEYISDRHHTHMNSTQVGNFSSNSAQHTRTAC